MSLRQPLSIAIIFILLSLLVATVSSAQNKDEQAIRNLLHKQTLAWNNGNLEAFMQGYWKSDSLLFIGKNGPKYGYNTTLENYQKSYPDTASMGKLKFDILQVNRLSDRYFSVVGKWHLQRSIGDVQGYFTLLFSKIGKQWLIVSDHSS
jgi:ketosteroid isomerase-like protein